MSYSDHQDWHSRITVLSSQGTPITDLVSQCLEQIERRNKSLNAFVYVNDAEALEAAGQADARRAAGQPLSAIDGMPVAIKDNISIQGVATSAGIRARKSCIATQDAPVVEQLRRAGAVIIGTTNLHEAALGATTDNPWFGRTHHPHKLGYTPGGSSGGSACAVAAKMASAALGTDTMGSVRLPASYCGIYGLKPTQGIVSIDAVVPLSVQLDNVGPLANSIADIRALMSVLVDDKAQELQGNSELSLTFTAAAPVDVSTLSAWAPNNLGALGVEQPIIDAINARVNAVAERGMTIDRAPLEWNLTALRYAGLLLVEHEAAAFHRSMRERAPQGFSKPLSDMLDYGLKLSPERLDGARQTMREVRENMQTLFKDVDVLMLPTTAHQAFSFDQKVPANQADLTGFVNLSGCPAISMPCPSDDGLPIGLQLITKMFNDEWLLNLAQTIDS